MFTTIIYIFQQSVLDEAHRILPNAHWWIKCDGVNLTCSLQEFVAGEWNGDVDLGDGKLQLLRSEIIKRLEAAPKLHDLVSVAHIQELVNNVEQDLNTIYKCKLVNPAQRQVPKYIYLLVLYTAHKSQLQSDKAGTATYMLDGKWKSCPH